MTNLKEKILLALRNNENAESVMKDLSRCQENLLKNYSNPVLDNKSRNTILLEFTRLKELIQSLSRYNKLKKYKYSIDAQEEKENVKNLVLTGGVSYNRYIWHSEPNENTCGVCRSLDGKTFDIFDEVPERPHPHCKCSVEILEDPDYEIEDIEVENDSNGSNSNKSNNHNNDKTKTNTPPQNPTPQPTPTPQSTQTPDWIMPCKGRIVGEFGEPRTTHIHNGIDIAVPVGTPIRAIADGTVVVAGPSSGYGYWVGISHGSVNGNKLSSEYGHLSKWVVNSGQKVKQGQIIAYSGNTGDSEGPHLHLTIRHGYPGKGAGVPVDPWIYIDPDAYNEE